MNILSFRLGKEIGLLLTLSFLAFISCRAFTPSFAQDSEQREIEEKIPKHLPIKVKFKKEKEEKIRSIKNDQWVRDFELEVTNTSDKPIYFLDFFLVIPEVTSESGGTLGMPLRYGRMAFVKQATRPLADDVPIMPNETYIFKIAQRDQRGWYKHKAVGYMRDPKKIELIFVNLSFGDGTGFRGTTGISYPHKNQTKVDLNDSFTKSNGASMVIKDVRRGFPDLVLRPVFDLRPAAWLPVRFSRSGYTGEPQSGLCCPGTPCSYLKNTTYYCSCKEAHSIDTASCSDADGECATSQRLDSWCDDLGVGCPEFFLKYVMPGISNTNSNTHSNPDVNAGTYTHTVPGHGTIKLRQWSCSR